LVNYHLVCDPTIRQPGFDLPRQQWSLLNRFCTEQGHCGACRRKWQLTDTDLCPCGENQTMFDIVESCPLTKLNGGLSRLHSANEDAVLWLTSYGSWHAYQKKKIAPQKYVLHVRVTMTNIIPVIIYGVMKPVSRPWNWFWFRGTNKMDSSHITVVAIWKMFPTVCVRWWYFTHLFTRTTEVHMKSTQTKVIFLIFYAKRWHGSNSNDSHTH